MAVTFFNATATSGAASAGARTVTLVSTAGACLLVWVNTINSTVSISAMAAGLNPMTQLGAVNFGGCRQELWALSSVPTGTLTISAIPVGVATTRWCMAAASYIGQREVGGSPFGTVVSGTGTAANIAFSISSTSVDLVAFGFGISANTAATINGTTRASATCSTGGLLVIGDIVGAANTSLSATAVSSGVWGFLGVPIVASATPTTSIVFDNAAVSGGAAGVNTFGMLLTATTNAVLLVFINAATIAGTFSISAVNVGANQLSLLGTVAYGGGGTGTMIWGLTAPPSGVLTISAVAVGTNTVAWGMNAVTYVGHKTTATPFGGVGIASGAAVTTVNVSVSSTAGNVVVMGFGNRMFDPVSISVGAAFTIRKAPGLFPSVMLVDTIGAPSITGSAQASSAIAWGVVGINLIQAGPNTNRSAIAAMTDAPDAFSTSGNVRVSGSLIKTDTADTFSAPAGVRVRGSLSATNAADTFATSANVRVTGSFVKTDTQDTFAASANARVSGSFIKTDTADAFVGTAGVRVTGLLSATDATDAFLANGSGNTPRTGSFAATDATDTFIGTAAARVTTTFTATDAQDTLVASGTSSSALAPVVTINIPSAGGGSKRSKRPEYIRLGSDWWDARERYLLSLQPDMVEPQLESAHETTIAPDISPATVSPFIEYRAQRTLIIDAIPLANNMRELRATGERLRAVNRKIIEQQRVQQAQLSFERAEAALVKADTAERRAIRQQRIKQKRVLVATLEVARQVVRLFGNHPY